MLDAVEHTEAKTEKPIKFRIIWGSQPDECSSVSEYEFATEAEADAFWDGAKAAWGWNGYTMLEDGDTVPEDDAGCVTVDETGEVIILDADGTRVERELRKF
jgi:hypothetical protein